MKCPKCSYRLGVTAKFCPSCGMTVDERQSQLPSLSPPLASSSSAPLAPPPPLPEPSTYGSPSMNLAGPDSYYLLLNGQQNGPFTVNQMKSMWQNGGINAGTQYWQAGMGDWQTLANIRHFLDAPAMHTPPAPIVINQVNQNTVAPALAYDPRLLRSPKSRGTYIVLGLFLGCFGIHNFYAGYAGRGIAQLLITLFLGWFAIGFFITGLWALIDIIVVSRDAQGLPM